MFPRLMGFILITQGQSELQEDYLISIEFTVNTNWIISQVIQAKVEQILLNLQIPGTQMNFPPECDIQCARIWFRCLSLLSKLSFLHLQYDPQGDTPTEVHFVM